jgi:hypothetical protein
MEHPLCPDTKPNGAIRPYATMWDETEFVCCGNHPGECRDCPNLLEPGHIELQDFCALECHDCRDRLERESAEEMAEMGGLDKGEDMDEMMTETKMDVDKEEEEEYFDAETKVETDMDVD